MALAASERLFHPDDRVAVFIDGANLYQAAKALGFDIDYKRLLQTLAGDCRFLRAYYYTALLDEQEYSPIRPLVDWLDYNGYTMVTKPLKEFTQATGRRKLIFSGLLTEACVTFPVLSARAAGYEVHVVGDACGGLTPVSHDLAMRRMEAAGAKPTSWIQVLLELQRDWTRHETYDGARAIVEAHGGGYGIGLAYARDMVKPA